MSIATLEVTGLKIGIAVVAVAGLCGVTWFAADAHYSKALSSLEGQLKGAAAAQQKAVDQQVATDKQAAQEVDNETKQQIGSMAGTISDLSVRLQHAAGGRTITVRPGPPSAPVACVQSNGSAAAAGDRPVPEAAGPAAAAQPDPAIAQIPADILNGVLDVGKDAMKAELLTREYLRRTGQAK